MEASEWYDNTITGYFFCVFAAPASNSNSVYTVPSGSTVDGDTIGQHLGDGVYLRHAADAWYLEHLLSPLYESEGIGLSSSDDEIIPLQKLPALAAAIRSALVQVEHQPDTWPVHIGNRSKPFSEELGEPIYAVASRQRLVGFLRGVLIEIDLATQHGHDLCWGGGT